mmetsp:Transcript_64329/g.76158  ORF Transcript_64329/g.76158 Transcript_64329/m.76158 type:complete len:109 (+) Transcript_64329:2015-2341(+)
MVIVCAALGAIVSDQVHRRKFKKGRRDDEGESYKVFLSSIDSSSTYASYNYDFAQDSGGTSDVSSWRSYSSSSSLVSYGTSTVLDRNNQATVLGAVAVLCSWIGLGEL